MLRCYAPPRWEPGWRQPPSETESVGAVRCYIVAPTRDRRPRPRRSPTAGPEHILSGRLGLPGGATVFPALDGPSEDSEFFYRTFADREPAEWVQLEFSDPNYCLGLVVSKSSASAASARGRPKVSRRRLTRARAEFDERVVVDYLAIPKSGGALQVFAGGHEVRPARSVVETVYLRANASKREKVLNRIVLREQSPRVNLHWELERFSEFFAVDSNTSMHREGAVLVTSVCQGFFSLEQVGVARLRWEYLISLVTPAPAQERENLGWAIAIQWLQQQNKGISGLTGLVVDSELSNLERYSRRELPLLPGLPLPENWNLIYATSDAGTREFLPNKMVAAADTFNIHGAKRVGRLSFQEIWPHATALQRPVTQMYLATRPAVSAG